MKYQQGFNLIEQFIALVIAGLLLASLLVPLSIQCENSKRVEAQKSFEMSLYRQRKLTRHN